MTVGYRPKQLYGGGKEYNASPLEVIPVGIQRLVLLCPVEELPVQAEEENLGDENKLKSLATRALHYTWDEEALELTAAEEATTERFNTEEDPAYLSFAEVDMMLTTALCWIRDPPVSVILLKSPFLVNVMVLARSNFQDDLD